MNNTEGPTQRKWEEMKIVISSYFSPADLEKVRDIFFTGVIFSLNYMAKGVDLKDKEARIKELLNEQEDFTVNLIKNILDDILKAKENEHLK